MGVTQNIDGATTYRVHCSILGHHFLYEEAGPTTSFTGHGPSGDNPLKRRIALLCLMLLAWGCTGAQTLRPDASLKEKIAASAPPTHDMAMEKGTLPDTLKRRAVPRPKSAPSASGLKAAYADDNRQFNRFLEFLEKYKETPHITADVGERITLMVRNQEGFTLPDCTVRIRIDGQLVDRGKTTADGIFRTFPALYAGEAETLIATVRYNQHKKEITLRRHGARTVAVTLASPRSLPAAVPLDLLFILDTTGSMGEEIDRLKASIDLINVNLSELPTRPLIRYGMVLYRDRGDAYVTRRIPFTPNLQTFRKALATVRAEGGGDTPEDLESALKKGVDEMAWRDEGIRLAFVITDAPPHLDYPHEMTYIDAAHAAREKGIKIYAVGTGGLALDGEYILRQISQLTGGAYIFLTYGERGESEGGAPGSVSHHTGTNFTSRTLEAVIITITKNELSHLTPPSSEEESDYFKGVSGIDAPESVTDTLFTNAVAQLADYAAISLSEKPTVAVLPLASELSKPDGEYLSSALLIAATRHPQFTVVERDKRASLIHEITLGLSGLVDEATAAEAGRLTGAQLLMAGRIIMVGTQADVIIRLIRVETGEILSATRIRLGEGLLPSAWRS